MTILARGLIGVVCLGMMAACKHAPAHPAAAAPSQTAAPRTVQPGAPGAPDRVGSSTMTAAPRTTDADVKFMQGMIHHHAQAIEMVGLLKTHTATRDMQLLGLRIEVSQNDEIRMMQTWLKAHGADVPDTSHMNHAMPGMTMPAAMLMPGMLTPEQMAQLAASKDAEFDRLFLEFMIQHHEGALVMVKDLLASPGAAQDSSIFAFSSDVVADQSAEITRMRGMRAKMGKGQYS